MPFGAALNACSTCPCLRGARARLRRFWRLKHSWIVRPMPITVDATAGASAQQPIGFCTTRKDFKDSHHLLAAKVNGPRLDETNRSSIESATERDTVMDARIVLLPGDGIGPEVVAQAERVLRAVGERFRHAF